MTDEQDTAHQSETKLVKTFGPNERIVAMVEHKGMIIVASEKSVYRLINDEFHIIKFVPLSDNEEKLL